MAGTVGLVGRNDPAIVTGDLSLSLDVEHQTHLSAKINADDPDAGESRFALQPRTEGSYGYFSLSEAGDVSYRLFEAPPGELHRPIPRNAFEVFPVRTADGTAASVKIALVTPTDTADGAVQSGTPGNDMIQGSPRNDVLDGGPGHDTAIYGGARSSFSISRVGGSFSVVDLSGAEGRDTLVSIERLQFADKAFDLVNLPRAVAPDYGTSPGFLFDGVYYLLAISSKVPAVTLTTALDDYWATGAAQHLAPNSWFDAAHYANRWADLSALRLDDATLFMHYNLYGVWEGRTAGPAFDHFDGNRYLTDWPDVAAYVDANLPAFLGSRTNGAIAHFIIYGANEQRTAHDTAGALIDMGYVV